MLLRPRQKELVTKVVDALYANGNTLAVAPTGAGKTIMLSAVLGNLFERDVKRACVLVHRDELTFQNEAKFKRVNPNITTSIFNASEKNWDGQVAFAMVQTLSREGNISTLPPLDALVVDEAHHACSSSYMRVINQAKASNPKLKLLGMTATPVRGDKKGLRPIFSNIADQITVRELIASGHLVPPRSFVMDVGVQESLGRVQKTALDYDMGAVADIMNTRPINDAVVKHWQEKAQEAWSAEGATGKSKNYRQTVVFCSTVEHAKDVTTSFQQAGIATGLIWGDMGEVERHKTLMAYGKGDIQVIVNVGVLTEGWDHPPTSCVVLLRPSSFKSTMIQMIGRGLRTVDPIEHPNIIKKDCIVLDFGTSILIHGSLEQDLSFEENHDKYPSPYKDCPECNASVPSAVKECSLCGYVWVKDIGDESKEITDFKMQEIDLLKHSSFLWCDLFDDDQHFIAAGFEAWGGVFHHHDEWYAVGGRKNSPAQFLTAGERVVCFAAADDWINQFESESAAHKTKSWLHQAATEKQLCHLPPEYRNDYSLTRYKASALMTLRFNRQAIKELIHQERIAA